MLKTNQERNLTWPSEKTQYAVTQQDKEREEIEGEKEKVVHLVINKATEEVCLFVVCFDNI